MFQAKICNKKKNTEELIYLISKKIKLCGGIDFLD